MLNIHLQTSRDFGGLRLRAKNTALATAYRNENGLENSNRACLLHLFIALWERIGNPQNGGILYDLGNANLCVETWHDC
jgi:hypothetical protein